MKRYFSLILAIAATVSAQIVPSTGNVRGPTSATDNAVARYDGTTGKLIQNSGVTIDDSGNLTVSGGGQSYVDGSLRVGSATTPKGKLDAQGTYDGSAPSTSSTPIIRANNGGAISLWMGGSAYSYMWQQAIQDDGSNNTKPIAFQPLGGPVLIGGTTDNGNGNLQLKDTTGSSTKGIGFGADTALYRAAAQSLNLDGASSPQFSLSVSGTQKARFESYSDDLYISTLTAGKSIILRSGNGTTALTLDSSQNATFAGSVRPEATPSSKWGIDFAASGASGALVSIANDGTYDLAVGSGMVFLWDDGGNGVSQIATYYGITAIVWQSGANLYSTTVDTANKVNVYYNAGTNKYRIQNKFGSTVSIYVSTLKLRGGS